MWGLIAASSLILLGMQPMKEKPQKAVYKYASAASELPWIPEDYGGVDLKGAAIRYAQEIFNGDGRYFYEAPGLYHTEKTRFGIVSVEGEEPDLSNVEAMTLISALLSAQALGNDTLPVEEINRLAAKIEGYYSLDEGENIFLNYMDVKSRDLDFYQQVYPGLLYFMIMDRLEASENSDAILRQIAESWYEVVMDLGGNDRLVDFGYAGYDFTAREPFHRENQLEPDGAAGIALIQYYAFQKYGDKKYMRAAQFCMDYLDRFDSHYGYRLLYLYTPYLAARLNAQEGFEYDVAKHMGNYLLPNESNWGWMGPENFASGMIGSRTEYGGTAYTYESIMGLAALIPMAKYETRYAKDIGKLVLHGIDELSKQGTLICRSQDVVREEESVKARLALGYLASMAEPTDQEGILKIDLNVGDFYQKQWDNPSFLLFNPYEEPVTITYEPRTRGVVLYDLLRDEYLNEGSSRKDLEIPPQEAVIVIEIPVERGESKYQVQKKVGQQTPKAGDASVHFKDMKLNETLTADKKIELDIELKDCTLDNIVIEVDGAEVFKNVVYDVPYVLKIDELRAGYRLIKVEITASSGTKDTAYAQVFVDNGNDGGKLEADGELIRQWGGTSPEVTIEFGRNPILELHLSRYEKPWSLQMTDVASGVMFDLRQDSIEGGQVNINLTQMVEDGDIRLYGPHTIQLHFPEDLPLEGLRIFEEGFDAVAPKGWAAAFNPQKMIHWPAGLAGQLNYRNGEAALHNGVSKTIWFEVDMSKKPHLKLKMATSPGVWSVMAYADGADGPKYLQYPTSKTGTFTYDLAEKLADDATDIQFWIVVEGEEEAPAQLRYLKLAYQTPLVKLASAGAVGILVLIMFFVETRRET